MLCCRHSFWNFAAAGRRRRDVMSESGNHSLPRAQARWVSDVVCIQVTDAVFQLSLYILLRSCWSEHGRVGTVRRCRRSDAGHPPRPDQDLPRVHRRGQGWTTCFENLHVYITGSTPTWLFNIHHVLIQEELRKKVLDETVPKFYGTLEKLLVNNGKKHFVGSKVGLVSLPLLLHT